MILSACVKGCASTILRYHGNEEYCTIGHLHLSITFYVHNYALCHGFINEDSSFSMQVFYVLRNMYMYIHVVVFCTTYWFTFICMLIEITVCAYKIHLEC